MRCVKRRLVDHVWRLMIADRHRLAASPVGHPGWVGGIPFEGVRGLAGSRWRGWRLMGLWATVLVCRGEEPLEDFGELEELGGFLEQETALAGGWQVGRFEGSAFYGESSRVLPLVVERTGAPALLAVVLDSDCVVLTGWHAGQRWQACLVRGPAREYLLGVEDFDSSVGERKVTACTEARLAGA